MIAKALDLVFAAMPKEMINRIGASDDISVFCAVNLAAQRKRELSLEGIILISGNGDHLMAMGFIGVRQAHPAFQP